MRTSRPSSRASRGTARPRPAALQRTSMGMGMLRRTRILRLSSGCWEGGRAEDEAVRERERQMIQCLKLGHCAALLLSLCAVGRVAGVQPPWAPTPEDEQAGAGFFDVRLNANG